MWEKLLRWVIFGVAISLAPIAFAYCDLVIKTQPVNLAALLGGGEGLGITWSLCAGAIGELFGKSGKIPLLNILCGGLCLLVLIGATLLFASVSEQKISKKHIDENKVLVVSIILFGSGIVTCGSCIALSEL